MNCDECKIAQKRYQDESVLALAERTIRRLWITILVLIVIMAGMAVGFFVYESQFEEYSEYSEYEAEVDAFQVGEDNFVAGGDINYGYADGEGENP